MNLRTALLAAGVAFAVYQLLPGCASLGTQPRISAQVVQKTGETVRLHLGGHEKANILFCIGETVPVFRAYPQERLRYLEVGKVRITRFLADNYLDGIVTEGEIQEGDLARKPGAECLVLPPTPAEKPE